ncbi:tail protein [Klebsiella pneumoniae]|uniref:Tail protein n=1 Tax=Klebsiella pneumoniae TaxID=573 RepID=A0A377TRS9_KLEPN|nr:tail protein [Klebsiella pneumoniae]
MSALFERAQKTVVMITSVPVTAAELDTATWLNLSCTIKTGKLYRWSEKRY